MRFKSKAWYIVFAIYALLIGGVSIAPQATNIYGSEDWVGYFTGLGLLDNDSFLGRRFYRFRIRAPGYGFYEIEDIGKKFNPMKRFYPNGSLAISGECEILRKPDISYPLIDSINWAVSFKPDGTKASAVENGSGTLICFYPDGMIFWESQYQDYLKISSKSLDQSGAPMAYHQLTPLTPDMQKK